MTDRIRAEASHRMHRIDDCAQQRGSARIRTRSLNDADRADAGRGDRGTRTAYRIASHRIPEYRTARASRAPRAARADGHLIPKFSGPGMGNLLSNQ
eukprot:SAG31_NODE_812_length_11915_cov_64.697360_3_plen_97_part_00